MGILTRLFQLSAATPENPTFNLSSPEAWDTFLGGSSSSSGLPINSRTALCYAPVWRAVSLLSRDVAKLPLCVYRRQGEGKERDTSHPAHRLLRYRPNEAMTAFVFRQTLQAHVLTRGNAYAYIMRRGDGQPEELWPLDPDTTYPVREGNRVWYVVQVDGTQRKLSSPDVLHIKGMGFDGLMGYDPITMARESLGLGLATEKYGAVFFGNAARPGVVLLHPDKLAENAKRELRESWERMHQGLDRAHRTAVLDRGLTVKELTISAENAQYIETRAFQIRDVANWFCVPPHKVGDTTRTAYASLEQENQAYLDDGLDPWLVLWEEECQQKLLSEQEKDTDSRVIEFIRAALVRANLTDRGNYYRTALGGRPWMTQNEVRGRENLNPMEDGDTILEPLNMGDSGGADNEEKPSAPAQQRKAVLTQALAHAAKDAAHRVIRRIAIQANKAAKDPAKYLAWLDVWPEQDWQAFWDMMRPGIDACAAWMGTEPAHLDAVMVAMIHGLKSRLENLANTCTATTLAAAVEQAMSEEEATFPSRFVACYLPEVTP